MARRDEGEAAAAGAGQAQGGQRGRRQQTLAERVHSRPSVVTGAAVGSRWPDDAMRGPRSFRLLGATLLRLQATVHGIQARTYGTAMAGKVPATLDDLVNEAIEAACTHYEDVLNNGEEFARENVRLATGPRPGRERQAAPAQVRAGTPQ
jgi:hypothetical protein